MFRQRVAVLVVAQRKVCLLELLVLARMYNAAREACDQRRIFAALGVHLLGAQVPCEEQYPHAEWQSEEISHGRVVPFRFARDFT